MNQSQQLGGSAPISGPPGMKNNQHLLRRERSVKWTKASQTIKEQLRRRAAETKTNREKTEAQEPISS
ncbi:hypothetical protein ILYODFUR_037937 [Ilyodon furcidens]|uniref:Uncharacterized protein n=1 Tax=Ilyodon furcidens TaxID=33524 RepID=A0ABV0TRG3_9TELE